MADNSKFQTLADVYADEVHSAEAAAVNGEPEAQLTTPVSNLL